jgi:hypothetical protein
MAAPLLDEGTAGQATLPVSYSFTTADAGTHTFSGLVLRTAGSRAPLFASALDQIDWDRLMETFNDR